MFSLYLIIDKGYHWHRVIEDLWKRFTQDLQQEKRHITQRRQGHEEAR